jgi:hypothetical protein
MLRHVRMGMEILNITGDEEDWSNGAALYQSARRKFFNSDETGTEQ